MRSPQPSPILTSLWWGYRTAAGGEPSSKSNHLAFTLIHRSAMYTPRNTGVEVPNETHVSQHTVPHLSHFQTGTQDIPASNPCLPGMLGIWSAADVIWGLCPGVRELAGHKRPAHSADITGLFLGLSPAERKVRKSPLFPFQRCHTFSVGVVNPFDSASQTRARLGRKDCKNYVRPANLLSCTPTTSRNASIHVHMSRSVVGSI